MPMAGLISKRVLCMHGGLSPHLTSLEQIRQIKRPCEPLVSVNSSYNLLSISRLLFVNLIKSVNETSGSWIVNRFGLVRSDK